MAELNGGCLCGSVRYACEADPMATANCHCTDCQRQTGSAFSTFIAVPRDAFQVEGDTLSSYTTTGEDTGKETTRHFCTNCGSPVMSFNEAMPDVVFIKAGSLDDRSWVSPQLDVFCDSAQPWVVDDSERPRFARMPPVPG
jgi:hypothetical protein